jgi:hypothetical protein
VPFNFTNDNRFTKISVQVFELEDGRGAFDANPSALIDLAE